MRTKHPIATYPANMENTIYNNQICNTETSSPMQACAFEGFKLPRFFWLRAINPILQYSQTYVYCAYTVQHGNDANDLKSA